MPKYLRKALAALALFLAGAIGGTALAPTDAALAQVACPPGTVAMSGGSTEQSYAGCIPMDPGQEGGRAPRWESRWGAVAITDGAFGHAANYGSEAIAASEALGACRAHAGSNRCEVKVVYHDQCVALAWGDQGYTIFRGPELRKVEGQAMQDCQQHQTNCRLFYSECSYPERVE